MGEAWVTLATNDAYAAGALVLAASLRKAHTTRPLHILYTKDVSAPMCGALSAAFDNATLVDTFDSADAENLRLIGRPDLGVTFTKLHCWRLTQYSKCVFLDADTLVLANADELFAKEQLSAAPDFGWPDCFNSGLFVFVPSVETYRALMSAASQSGSFDGGDQGLLNEFFGGWRSGDADRRLSVAYNMSSSAIYTYAAAYRRYGSSVKIVHFLGSVKPWDYSLGSGGAEATHPTGKHQPAHIAAWWGLYLDKVHAHIGAKAAAAVGGGSGAFAVAPASSEAHKSAVEDGFVDVQGRDSFANVQAQIDKTLAES